MNVTELIYIKYILPGGFEVLEGKNLKIFIPSKLLLVLLPS